MNKLIKIKGKGNKIITKPIFFMQEKFLGIKNFSLLIFFNNLLILKNIAISMIKFKEIKIKFKSDITNEFLKRKMKSKKSKDKFTSLKGKLNLKIKYEKIVPARIIKNPMTKSIIKTKILTTIIKDLLSKNNPPLFFIIKNLLILLYIKKVFLSKRLCLLYFKF